MRNKDSNEVLEKALTGEIIQLSETAEFVTSTSINITWKIYKSAFLIEGLLLKYKPVGSRDYTTETLNYANHRSQDRQNYVIKNLNKFTTYEILIEPFAGPIRGSESNVIQIKTKEDVPTQMPLHLHVEMDSISSLAIKWQPPSLHHMNGNFEFFFFHIFSSFQVLSNGIKFFQRKPNKN
jgi:roundabout axon guidance receptor 2